MSPVEMLQQRERAAWLLYCETQKTEDLATWRREVQALNDEVEHRIRLLSSAHRFVRTSGKAGTP